MLNSPIAALASSLIASQRLDNVPNAEAFRNNYFVAGLLCGNPAAQLVFNMRSADDLADVLKERASLQTRLSAQRFAIIRGPAISGPFETGKALTAVPGLYEGLAPSEKVSRIWLDGEGEELADGDSFTPEMAMELRLRETFNTTAGRVSVTSPAVKVTQANAAPRES